MQCIPMLIALPQNGNSFRVYPAARTFKMHTHAPFPFNFKNLASQAFQLFKNASGRFKSGSVKAKNIFMQVSPQGDIPARQFTYKQIKVMVPVPSKRTK